MKPLPIENHVPRELLEPLYGKRVLITGANGFVGRWMYETLLQVKDIVAQWGGIHDRRGWGYAETQDKFDFVIHCTTDGDELERAMECLAPDGRMLYLSSGAVYGEQTCREAYGEHRQAIPTTVYGAKKRLHEMQCRNVAVIARLFSFIGPGLRRHTGKEFLEADPIQVKNPYATRSYLYAGDMARWLWTVLFKGQVGQCYNVGSIRGRTVLDFAKSCSEIRGKCVLWPDKPSFEFGTDYYVPDTSRAENELGLRKEVGLEDAIRRTLAWQRDE